MTLITDQTSAKSRQLGSGLMPEIGTASASAAIADLNESYSACTNWTWVSSARFVSVRKARSQRAPRLPVLSLLTNKKAQGGSESLLEELAVDRGLGWTDVARLCGVSISAVRKWRSGGALAPERLRSLSKLAAFLEILSEVGPIDDPVGWLMMPLVEQHTITAAGIYRAGHDEDILEHAQGNLTVEELLDRWNSTWRTDTRSDWMVVERPDGERVITRRS
ncbi:helix-turn-helix domain-containing protein [Candidatus Poriferisodalis sp.]|uniref:helix-turn-helix domain-containing protein n=1 Tax=Candidatus Poriferisodalis sp. TaxID=3101277 RepID=UPI003B51B24F